MKSLNGAAVLAAWGALAVGGLAVAQDADCNVNGIPDATEIAQGLVDDCNGNGIPDVCEYAGVMLEAEQSGFGNGNPLVATFTNLDPSLSDVRLTIAVRADLDSVGEFVQVKVGGSVVTTLWVTGGQACPSEPQSQTVTVPAGTFNAAGGADVVVMTPYGTATLTDGVFYSGDTLPWATTLEFAPDPAIVVDESAREAIAAAGLPWRIRDTTSAIEMILVPPGTFLMGTPDADPQLIPNEQPQHLVTISQPFYIGRYETTQAQWISAMGWNDSVFGGFPDSLNRPVERVTWHQVQQFMSNTGLRLPTEAEWEYAARGGSSEPRYGPINDIAWWGSCLAGCSGNANAQTHPVGQLSTNGFGLSDTLGNVWEWVEDWYGPYSAQAQSDPSGPSGGTEKVLRGGSWYDPDYNCRVSRRDRRHPDTFMTHPNLSGLGFRVARTP